MARLRGADPAARTSFPTLRMQENLYAIGDIQGCLESLEGLLEQLPADARIIFAGDIVNRGPQSLATLRLVRELTRSGRAAGTVLGNHDLHLLAVAAGSGRIHRKDTIREILEAPDCDELIDWLRSQPLLIETESTIFVHAGIPPEWTLEQARAYAAEAEAGLRSPNWRAYLQDMYGNEDKVGRPRSAARMRSILNGLTRMRFVDAEGRLDFNPKMNPIDAPAGFKPWFDCPRRIHKRICFGHWSTLGLLVRPDVVAVDTGCLWGGSLTAIRLSDGRIYTEQCPQWAPPGC